MKNYISEYAFVLLLLAVTAQMGWTQETRYTLNDALSRVQKTGAYNILYKDSLINDLRHLIFKGNALPDISLTAKLPEYDKSISLVSQYDGSYRYISRTFATSSLTLNIAQVLPFTGGTVRYSVGLDRIDNLTYDDKTFAYYLNLGKLSYTQNLFSYNAYKWSVRQDRQERVLESIRYRQEREKINCDIVNAFFNLLIQQQAKVVNDMNLDLSRYVYERSRILLQDGRISETDFIDTRIEYLRDSINRNDIELSYARDRFKTLLQLPVTEVPVVIFNDTLKIFKLLDFDCEEILNRCLEYNYDEEYQLKDLQSSIELKKAQAAKSPDLQLALGGGYDTQFEKFSQSFDHRLSSFNISLTLSIPIYNGKMLDNKCNMIRIQKQRLFDQNEFEKSTVKTDILKELSEINVVIKSINNSRTSLDLFIQQLLNIKVRLDNGRINVEQYLRLKSQYNQTYISYMALIKTYYEYIYKYRYLSLYDIELNRETI